MPVTLLAHITPGTTDDAALVELLDIAQCTGAPVMAKMDGQNIVVSPNDTLVGVRRRLSDLAIAGRSLAEKKAKTG
jgi:hypothetical protein